MSTGADRAREAPRIIVLCIGNPDRGDDAAGRAVARALRASAADVDIIEEEGEATRVLARLEGADAAYIVDASVSGAEPGEVRRHDVSAGPLPRAAFGASTHGFGLAEALELARALGVLPPRCIVYAIEGGTFDIGAPMSPAVAAAVDIVAGRLRADIVGK
ncbi:hydrogenase maturation protease [Methylocystis sp. H4A]|uniref:hydrogenase maturation protease n=1 Tax=Methylocystis sp. H4A TaxID=2785788 RepID=UPI0018C21F2B|nr:hydrogenase maturation protease [Methylocystis sp. H4A]MBG0800064.1 hydrogenase maturation protease [Methylocystis sp. H4A]